MSVLRLQSHQGIFNLCRRQSHYSGLDFVQS